MVGPDACFEPASVVIVAEVHGMPFESNPPTDVEIRSWRWSLCERLAGQLNGAVGWAERRMAVVNMDHIEKKIQPSTRANIDESNWLASFGLHPTEHRGQDCRACNSFVWTRRIRVMRSNSSAWARANDRNASPTPLMDLRR
jgi:hypothetical protein